MTSSSPQPVPLRRRGVYHGRFRPGTPEHGALERRWSEARPILLPGILAATLVPVRAEVEATRRMFERLRRGASFLREVQRRLAGRRGFRLAGAEVDTQDRREIEKVFADAVRGGRTSAGQLYAKLSWIADDPQDGSLRIRFSFGSEQLRDWQRETRRAPWAERYAQALFPECAAVDRNRPLRGLIERLVGHRARLSERIVYSNAPGGGALFHHDDEPYQHGVVFGQLQGATAWLALPKRELAAHVAACAGPARLGARASTPQRALRALEREGDQALVRLLDSTPAFTRRLVAAGALLHLRAGDALLLPNHGPDDTCWHSVFALGATPSLAHSYGIFALRRPRAPAEP